MLRPIHDQVLILPDPPPETLASGATIFPDVAKADNPNWFPVSGRVVRLGSHSFYRRRVGQMDFAEREGDLIPFSVKIGDRVTFNRFAGKQVTDPDDDVMYYMMRECEILGIADDDTQLLPGYEEADSMEVTDSDKTKERAWFADNLTRV